MAIACTQMFWLSLPATKTARPPTFYTSHSKSEKKRPTEKLKKKGGYILCVLAVNRASVPCVAHDAIDDLCPICV